MTPQATRKVELLTENAEVAVETPEELRDAVSKITSIQEITPALIHRLHLLDRAEGPFLGVPVSKEPTLMSFYLTDFFVGLFTQN